MVGCVIVSSDLQSMVDFYGLDTTTKQVAENFDVGVRSVTLLLRQHSVRGERLPVRTRPTQLSQCGESRRVSKRQYERL
jgi:hypothetical protein